MLWTRLVFVVLAWGLWPILMKFSVGKIGYSQTLVFGGIGYFAGATLLGLVLGKVASPNGFHVVAVGAGLVAALGALFFFQALEKSPAGIVFPLVACAQIVITVLLGYFFLRENMSPRIIAGICAAIMAIWLLSSPPKDVPAQGVVAGVSQESVSTETYDHPAPSDMIDDGADGREGK